MPLEDYLTETMALLTSEPDAEEILVERVKVLRNAELEGRYEQRWRCLAVTDSATIELNPSAVDG